MDSREHAVRRATPRSIGRSSPTLLDRENGDVAHLQEIRATPGAAVKWRASGVSGDGMELAVQSERRCESLHQ